MLTQSNVEFQREFELYLSRPEWDWTWFVTQTFDKQKNKFDKKRGFSKYLCQNSWGQFVEWTAEYSDLVYGFWFQEPHKSGFPHWHALVHVKENPLGSADPSTIWKRMFERYGRAKVRPVYKADTELTAARLIMYLTKYVAKEARRTHDTWGFGGLMDGQPAEASRFADEIGISSADHATFLHS